MTLFEKIIAREIPAKIVHEDSEFIAFHDVNPQAPIHILIVPKKVIPRIAEAEQGEAELLGKLLLTGKNLARQFSVAESGFRLVLNNGRNGGETIPHLHLHLLGGRPLTWPPG